MLQCSINYSHQTTEIFWLVNGASPVFAVTIAADLDSSVYAAES